MKRIAILIIILLGVSCSSDKPEPAKLTDGPAYFPMAEGDTWYYSDISYFSPRPVVRVVSGDTTVEGAACKRVLENDTTVEAWSVDGTGFKVHLLLKDHWAVPPLTVPFNLVEGKPYQYDSRIYFYEDSVLWYSDFSGTLEFKGYLKKTVAAGTFNAIKLHYKPADLSTEYDEYYARGVGLLDNGSYILDSAHIGGVWYK